MIMMQRSEWMASVLMPKQQASPRSGGQSSDIVCMMTIVLDNANGVYKAGDCIRGNVVFSLSKEVRVKDIVVSLTGYSRVRWDKKELTYTKGFTPRASLKHTETFIDRSVFLIKHDDGLTRLRSAGGGDDAVQCCFPMSGGWRGSSSGKMKSQTLPITTPSSRSTTSSRSSKQLLSSNLDLLQDDGGYPILPQGDSYLPFDITLPDDLPASFIGRHGFTKYVISAVILRPRAADVECKRDVTVLAIYDLNNDPDLARPAIAMEDLSTFCCFSGGSRVTVDLRLLRRACALGDVMPFRAEIINGSARNLYDICLSLVQDSVFKAAGQYKKARKTLVVMMSSRRSVTPGASYVWEGSNIMLPTDITPTTIGNSHAITIRYFVRLTMRYSVWMRPFAVSVALFVGTVPFQPATVRSVTNRPSLTTSNDKVQDKAVRVVQKTTSLSSSMSSVAALCSDVDQKRISRSGDGPDHGRTPPTC